MHARGHAYLHLHSPTFHCVIISIDCMTGIVDYLLHAFCFGGAEAVELLFVFEALIADSIFGEVETGHER